MTHPYSDLEHPGRPQEPSGFFMVNALLRARIELNLESNDPVFDEDVNIYLADLLSSLLSPDRTMRREVFYRRTDSAVAAAAEGQAARVRSSVYQSNAEARFIQNAIFDSGGHYDRSRRWYEPTRKHALGQARMYYQYASNVLRSLGARDQAHADIFEKMSTQLYKYTHIVRHACREDLGLIRGISAGTMFHLWRKVVAVGARADIEQKRNDFLDLYAEYLHGPNRRPLLKARLNSVIEELTELDPEFQFSGSL